MSETNDAVRDHYTRYAALLDEQAWFDWLNLFADDATYRITTRDNELRSLPAGIMLCTNRLMLADRVDAGRQANIYRKHVNRHLLGQPTIEQAMDQISASCPFCVVQTEEGAMPFVFAVGRYKDKLVRSDGGLVIRSKTVILDNAQIMTSMPIPI